MTPPGPPTCHAVAANPGSPSCTRPIAIPTHWDWPEFWEYVHTWMKQQGYAHSTARLYRQVLRNFVRFANIPPAAVSKQHVDHYLNRLGYGHCSAHWSAINLSTLRTIFDKVFGLDLLVRKSGPRRPLQLPYILNQQEVCALLDAATTLRDRLLVGLLYGCGLSIGELRRLRWQDLNPDDMSLQAAGNLQLLPRTVRLPDAILPLVRVARAQCPPDGLVFAGAREGRALSCRWIEELIRIMAERAEILKPVSPRSLRDTYAVHCLEAGANIREVQTALGHRSVSTTLKYTRCMLPRDARSPLDMMADRLAEVGPPSPAEALPTEGFETVTELSSLVTSPAGFFQLLRMQLGKRLFARRRSIHPPYPRRPPPTKHPPNPMPQRTILPLSH